MASRRWSALILLLALLGGGFGLPLADVVVYHTGPAASAASHSDQVAVGSQSSSLHLQGCVLWLSGLTGSGIAGSAPAIQVARTSTGITRFTTPLHVLTQTDIALGQSRAPPIA